MAKMGRKAEELAKQMEIRKRNLVLMIVGLVAVVALALGVSFKDELASCFARDEAGEQSQSQSETSKPIDMGQLDVSAADVSPTDLELCTFKKGDLYFEYYSNGIELDDQYDEAQNVSLLDNLNFNDGFNVYVSDEMAGVDLKEFTDGYIDRVAAYGEIVDRSDSDTVTEEGWEQHFCSYTFVFKDDQGNEYKNMVAIKILRDGGKALIANCSIDPNISFGSYNSVTRALATVTFADAA